MAGVQVPLVLLPRYTTYAGVTVGGDPAFFTTVGMEVTRYASATVSVWRGPILGGGSPAPTMSFNFEESTDLSNWTACGTSGGTSAPEPNEESTTVVTLRKRWFRLRVLLTGDAPVVNCWAVGFLEERES
jgi:hypothetical protein